MKPPTKSKLKKYNLTLAGWFQLAADQLGLCGICSRSLTKNTSLHRGKLVHPLCPGRYERLASERSEREAEIGIGMFVCGHCKTPTDVNDFPKGRKTRNGQQRYAYCKKCHTAIQRVKRLQKLFSLSEEDYASILLTQGGVCFICRQLPKLGRHLAVDHDHTTGLIRGLLCSFCNRAIAVFRDDMERLERAVSYLKDSPATKALGAPRFGLKGRTSNRAATRNRLNRDLFQRPKSVTGAK